MTEPIILPPGVAIGVLAFLLSLLPAGLFMWLWYLRRHDRPVPISTVITGFIAGLLLVIPAFFAESWAPRVWAAISPSTVHYYEGAVLPLTTLADVLLPAVGTFLIVALVEEGVRYLTLAFWFQRSKKIDQTFDGLVVGFATGLGFATLENSLYFYNLFASEQLNTLVFVFFLRFLISTIAHLTFGGIMGTLLARATFSYYRRWPLYLQAALIPWALHGAYDWLLGVNLTAYAVLLLLVPLLTLIVWSNRREFFIVARERGQFLVNQKPPHDRSLEAQAAAQAHRETPWNINAPWMSHRRLASSGRKAVR